MIRRGCPRCHGTGVVGEGPSARACPVCGGTGVVTLDSLPTVAVGYEGHNDDDGDGEGT